MDKAGTQLQSESLCIDSFVGIKEIFRRNEVVRVENDIVKQVNWNEEKKIMEMESDAVTELISAGVFETDMLKGTMKSMKPKLKMK